MEKEFKAKRNPTFEIANANEITYPKDGYDTSTFSFPNENGNQISLEDKAFKNKVTIVQIMGTWCPNCLDESKYFSKYLLENPDKELRFIALDFEVAKTKEKAFERIQCLKNHLGITYPIVSAQYGGSNKKVA